MRLLRADSTSDLAREEYRDAVPIPAYEKRMDIPHDRQLHVMAGREIEADPLRFRNRIMLIHASVISGRPGFDYQNPYAFFAKLWHNTATLQTNYGGGSQTAAGIAQNIAAGNSMLKKTTKI